jgi:hypothetical protein
MDTGPPGPRHAVGACDQSPAERPLTLGKEGEPLNPGAKRGSTQLADHLDFPTVQAAKASN